MLGKHHSEETRKKISMSCSGMERPWLRGDKNPAKRFDVRKRISLAMSGRKLSINFRENRSLKYTGDGNPFFGKHHSYKSRKKISDSKMVLYDKGLGYPFWKHRTIESYRKSGETLKKRYALGEIISCNKGKKRPHLSGRFHPNWMGGISGLGYVCSIFNEELKELVRNRFGRICLLCFNVENGRRFCVHHVDYDKKNNALNNLVPLHKGCHSLTGGERDKWMFYFQNIIMELCS